MLNETFNYFANLIERELGIVYSDFNRYQLENRLEDTAKAHGLKSVEELLSIIQSNRNPSIKQKLFDVATNNETSFFRDARLFESIERHVLREFSRRSVKVWCAACSTGQEPYSLAMMHLNNPVVGKLEILATDVASHALQRAREARYSAAEVDRGLSPAFKAQFLEPQASGVWAVKSTVKSLVRFERLNLLEPMGSLDQFDIVLCRNVLIYQNVANKARVVAELKKHVKSGGYLILGAGESLLGVSNEFTPVRNEGVIYYKYEANRAA